MFSDSTGSDAEILILCELFTINSDVGLRYLDCQFRGWCVKAPPTLFSSCCTERQSKQICLNRR